MHFSQVLPVNVRIDLRGRDVGVPQKLLYRRQIGPTLQKVGGKGVSERMR